MLQINDDTDYSSTSLEEHTVKSSQPINSHKKAAIKKKISIVGEKIYIDKETGESQVFNVVNIEDVDSNFDKIWLAHILSAIDEIGNAKIKILSYILENREKANNSLIITTRELAQATDTSLDTVSKTLKSLEKNDIIKRKVGSIMLCPSAIFKGKHKNRMNVLYQYRHFSEE
jgi:DNA-binding transcriptional ArsR family regulator